MDRSQPHLNAGTIRSLLLLEVGEQLVSEPEWSYQRAQLTLLDQGAGAWTMSAFGSDVAGAIAAVARGEVQIAAINPTWPLTLALRGTGPFGPPVPVRAIAVLPSLDQLGFAVGERTGLTSLADIRDRRYPLRVSLRGKREHSAHFMIQQVLAAVGFSLDDVVTWGGDVRYDPGLPPAPNRLGAVARGEVDAIFDEAVPGWAGRALELGMRFLPLEEPRLQRMETLGFRRATIARAAYPRLAGDVMTLDFSGWPIFTHAEVPDGPVTALCAALEARKDRIRWQGEGPLPLEQMCRDTPEGPLDVPLHPAAERYWRARGYLS